MVKRSEKLGEVEKGSKTAKDVKILMEKYGLNIKINENDKLLKAFYHARHIIGHHDKTNVQHEVAKLARIFYFIGKKDTGKVPKNADLKYCNKVFLITGKLHVNVIEFSSTNRFTLTNILINYRQCAKLVLRVKKIISRRL